MSNRLKMESLFSLKIFCNLSSCILLTSMNRESIGCDTKFVEQQNTINNMFKRFVIIATNGPRISAVPDWLPVSLLAGYDIY